MTDGAALLRMLEPTVRPVSTPGTAASSPQTPQAPLDQRPFESLLSEAQQMAQSMSAAGVQDVQGAQDVPSASALSPSQPTADASPAASPTAPRDAGASSSAGRSVLPGLDQIENASLRRLIAQGGATPMDMDKHE